RPHTTAPGQRRSMGTPYAALDTSLRGASLEPMTVNVSPTCTFTSVSPTLSVTLSPKCHPKPCREHLNLSLERAAVDLRDAVDRQGHRHGLSLERLAG